MFLFAEPSIVNPIHGAFGGIRTHDLRLRRATLYPAELQTHYKKISSKFYADRDVSLTKTLRSYVLSDACSFFPKNTSFIFGHKIKNKSKNNDRNNNFSNRHENIPVFFTELSVNVNFYKISNENFA